VTPRRRRAETGAGRYSGRVEVGEYPMIEIGAIAIAVACFAFLFALLYVLERM